MSKIFYIRGGRLSLKNSTETTMRTESTVKQLLRECRKLSGVTFIVPDVRTADPPPHGTPSLCAFSIHHSGWKTTHSSKGRTRREGAIYLNVVDYEGQSRQRKEPLNFPNVRKVICCSQGSACCHSRVQPYLLQICRLIHLIHR